MTGLKYYMDTTSSTPVEFLPDEPYANANVEWNVVIPLSHLNELHVEAIKRLIAFRNLSQNWDSYNSPPPSESAINAATRIIELIDFNLFSMPRINPVSGGGLQFEWDLDARELEIEILQDGSIQYLRAASGEPVDEGQISSATSAPVNSLLLWLTSESLEEEAA